MMKQKLLIAALILACFSLMAYTAQANLILGARADSVSGAGLSIEPGSLQVDIIAGSAGTVTFGIYASFTNTDANHADDGLQGAKLHLISTGVVKGNMAPANLAMSPYAWNFAPGFQLGKAQDLNGDTFNDLGGLLSGGVVTTERGNEICPFSTYINPSTSIEGTRMLLPNESEFLIAEVTYTLAQTGVIGTSLVTASPWTRSSGASVGGFTDDGTAITQNSTNVSVGTSVTLNVIPEPSTLILLCMGCLALLAIRRRK